MSKPMNFIANGKLPDSGKRVLFFWKSKYGEKLLKRTSIGFHASKHSIEISEYEDEDWYDTDVNGTVYLPVGWYESGWETEQDSFISEPVIAWQEIPDFPASTSLTDDQLIAAGTKIAATKLYRAHTGCDVRSSIAYIKNIWPEVQS